MEPNRQAEWLKKQCYIALGQLMVGCADMRIDSCPMEGFKSDEVDEILGLQSQNLTSVVLLPRDIEHQMTSISIKPRCENRIIFFLKINKH